MSAAVVVVAVYVVGLIAFAASGLVELGLCAVALRQLDRDPWSRGEPWQQRQNHRERDREHEASRRAATLVVYSPLWPALAFIVAARIIGRLTKRTPARD